MLPDFELRFITRTIQISGKLIGGGMVDTNINILQYRTGEPDTTDDYTRWSKWQDIPVVTEGEA